MAAPEMWCTEQLIVRDANKCRHRTIVHIICMYSVLALAARDTTVIEFSH